jgi:putative flippase GtrA
MATPVPIDRATTRAADEWRRLAPFTTVGLLGFAVQLGALQALTAYAGWPWLPATLVSVELAVLHNFLWHERWTWIDRTIGPAAAGGTWHRLGRFHAANGLTSIAGNALVMAWLVGVLAVPAVAANALAVAVTSIVNFLAADRWVFATRAAARAKSRPALAATKALVVFMAAAASAPAEAAGLGPQDQPQTVAAWERYVAAAEAALANARTPIAARPASDAVDPDGTTVPVPGGTINDWRGAVFIPHLTLDRLLHGLQHPGTPPPQEDVVSSRVLARGADSLHVGIRLVRHAIVTVSYDTEHQMQFRRVASNLATARSIATRIDQVGGGDHGFLWRLHSYWRYEEIGGGVLVELRSLTLSRSVPALVRPIAGPLVNRVARESMVRTLEALRKYFGGARLA